MTHDEFHNLTTPYLAGALSDEEVAGFEAHAASCPPCAALLERARMADREMDALFAAARPDDALEDRVIGRLRAARRSPSIAVHPMVRRAAVGVAAAILLGGAGFIVTQGDAVQRVKTASNLKHIGDAIAIYSNESK